MLKELYEMTAHIEQLSRTEHDLIREMHPNVSAIKEHVENVDAVAPGDSNDRRLDLSRLDVKIDILC